MYIRENKNEISFTINFEDLDSYTQRYVIEKLGLGNDIVEKMNWRKEPLTTVYWQKTENGKLVRIRK